MIVALMLFEEAIVNINTYYLGIHIFIDLYG